jgi:hypothetical protein
MCLSLSPAKPKRKDCVRVGEDREPGRWPWQGVSRVRARVKGNSGAKTPWTLSPNNDVSILDWTWQLRGDPLVSLLLLTSRSTQIVTSFIRSCPMGLHGSHMRSLWISSISISTKPIALSGATNVNDLMKHWPQRMFNCITSPGAKVK